MGGRSEFREDPVFQIFIYNLESAWFLVNMDVTCVLNSDLHFHVSFRSSDLPAFQNRRCIASHRLSLQVPSRVHA